MLLSFIFAVLFSIFAVLVVKTPVVKILSGLGVGISTYILFYFGMPVLNYGFYGLPFIVFIMSLAIFGICALQQSEGIPNKNGILLSFIVTVTSFLFLSVVPILSTWPGWMGNDAAYRNLIKIDEFDNNGNSFDFSNDVKVAVNKTIRLIDRDTAKKLAETRLNSEGSLGSTYQLGTFNISSLDGRSYWVAPLVWVDTIKWMFGPKGTPGYIMVSENNPHDIKLVTSLHGKNLSLRYLAENSPMHTNLERYLWTRGYQSSGLTDYTFELDENGNPFYVISKYELKVGYSGAVITGVVVVDPQTGSIKEFDIDNIPSWIERVQPESIIASRVSDWGEYIEGYWNMDGSNILKPTPGMALVQGSNGSTFWFTGVQTKNADQGIAGFVLIDTRTGNGRLYRSEGLTEDACQTNIRQAFAEKAGWSVSKCIMYNINGVATYIAIVKDADGNPKQVAVASIQYRDIMVYAEDLNTALRRYASRLANVSSGKPLSTNSSIEFTATIDRINEIVTDGNTIFYMTALGIQDKIFIGNPGVVPLIILAKSGDDLKIVADDMGNGYFNITKILNGSTKIEQ